MTDTARNFVNMAAKEAGILGVGQTLLAEDIDDCFKLLTRMLSQWQKRRWLVPSLRTVSALGNNLKSNPIGDGQYYNTPRPDKIQSAYMIQVNTGGTPVSLPLRPIWSHEDYDRIAIKDLNSLPTRFFYDGRSPVGNVFIWPVPSAMYRIYLTIKDAIGFATGIDSGTFTAGFGYTDGVYVDVPFVGGVGIDGVRATADVTVTGGVVTVCDVHNPGNGYVVGNELTITAANIGGTGAGFLYTVTGLESTLDSKTDMPPEYDEAMHYNLVIRICSMYRRKTNPSTIGLARAALNTIRNANIQVPTLRMPDGLVNNGNYFYIFNADGYG